MKTFLQTLFFFLLVTQICLAQWYQQNSPTIQNLNAVTFIDVNNGFAVGDSGIIIHTTDGGSTWANRSSGTLLPLNEISFIDASNGWIVGENSILHTTDGGRSWVTQLNMPPYTFFDVFFLDSDNGFVVGGAIDTLDLIILQTDNAGLSWTPSYFAATGYISRIQFIDSSTGWYLSHVATMYGYGFAIFKTEDGGASWTYKQGREPGPHIGDPLVYDIYFKDADNGLAIGDVIYRTTDGCDTWIDTIAIAPGQWLNRMCFSSINKVTAVGGNGIIYQSTDDGATWLSQTSGSDSSLNGIYFVDELKGWTVGGGGTILHTTNGGVSFVEEEQIDEVPTEFFLSNNYPNPFNPSTKIKYSVMQSSNVIIKVFDILGNEIETLVSEEKPAGTYEVTWHAVNQPSGVYFYQLKAGEYTAVKKMILIK